MIYVKGKIEKDCIIDRKGNCPCDLLEEIAGECIPELEDLRFDEWIRCTIDNLFIRFYITSTYIADVADVEEEYLIESFGGVSKMKMKVKPIGYSEYTITGYDIKTGVFGGHNLKKILDSHIDKYIHFFADVIE